jgi:hypothetical protein
MTDQQVCLNLASGAGARGWWDAESCKEACSSRKEMAAPEFTAEKLLPKAVKELFKDPSMLS